VHVFVCRASLTSLNFIAFGCCAILNKSGDIIANTDGYADSRWLAFLNKAAPHPCYSEPVHAKERFSVLCNPVTIHCGTIERE